MGNKEILKSTKYCDLLGQGRVDNGDAISALERIRVKSSGNDEIRFAYYKKTENGNDRMIPRPLDLSEDELLTLFEDAIDKNVFSPYFLKKLEEII
ncbi:hypothetical protein BSK59_28860 [Paenibacillus odorifer]|uniref:hypothetical protein n=1 Tax=Paenibacillus odorifer TaxID=189426 RepID=UPI00096F3E54|nr:hypothetical protein [Paenibacillus odorifer]OME46856.1 hypothetical protein BSK59_28860 [Paenibacillus odorifer]